MTRRLDPIAHWRRLPDVLRVMLVVLLLVPAWAMAFVDVPLAMLETGATARAGAVVAVFFVAPLLLAATMLARSVLFLPFFALALGGLAACPAFLPPEVYGQVQGVHLASTAVFAALTAAFFAKDLALPFLSGERRFWRKAPRRFANSALKLRAGEGDEVTVQMEDFSLIGFAVAGEAETVRAFLARHPGPTTFVLRSTRLDATREVGASVVWRRDVGPFQRLGLQVADQAGMSAFLTELCREGRGASPRTLFFLRPATQRVITVLWAAALALAFYVPLISAL